MHEVPSSTFAEVHELATKTTTQCLERLSTTSEDNRKLSHHGASTTRGPSLSWLRTKLQAQQPCHETEHRARSRSRGSPASYHPRYTNFTEATPFCRSAGRNNFSSPLLRKAEGDRSSKTSPTPQPQAHGEHLAGGFKGQTGRSATGPDPRGQQHST